MECFEVYQDKNFLITPRMPRLGAEKSRVEKAYDDV